MSDAFQPSPTAQPEPFGDRPTEPAGGCGRPVLVGCATATLLLGLLLIAFLWKAPDLLPVFFRWSLERVEEQIASALPDDLSDAERARLAAAFDAAADAVEDGTADPAALQRMQQKLMEALRAGSLTREQVVELAAALEAVAGAEAAEPPSDAAPQPPPEQAGPVAALA